MTKLNNIATAADIRQFAEAESWTKPERLQLPKSGLAVILRRPTKFYWALRRSAWPRELCEKLDLIGVGVKPDLSVEETLLLLREDRQMLNEVFVHPKPSFEPSATQFDPSWLPKEDTDFILRYLRGQVLANGQDLESFSRGKSGPVKGSGGDGTPVCKDPEPDVVPGGGTLADR